ncbi:MAG: hypothetical protein K6U89_02805 [Chloroflexi bacterium]|nr:hypothetical protein [Chloroflexota bacterium]
MAAERRWGVALAFLLVGGVLILQAGIATVFTFRPLADREFRWTTGLYTQLADAFAHGRLDFRVDPPAALATLADPYDPDQRYPSNPMLDVSYARGRYYLYFGPLPAALLAPLAPLLDLRDLPDAVLALPFLALLTLATGALVLVLWRRVVPRVPGSYPALAFLVAGLGMPLPMLLSHPAVYETAIGAGSALLVLAVTAAILAGQQPRWWWGVGVAGALALLARLALAPALALLLLGAGWQSWRQRSWLPLLGAGLPLALAALALGWYNWARFGSPVETGHRLQLAGFDLAAHYDRFFSPAYLLPNALFLLLTPPLIQPVFPFLALRGPALPLPAPTLWRTEPAVGLLLTNPYLLLALAAPLGLAGRSSSAAAGVVRALAALVVAAALPGFLQRYATTRYLADFSPLLVALAFVVAASWRQRSRSRWLVDSSITFLALAAVISGLLLGLNGRYELLPRHNPALAAAWHAYPTTRTLDDTVLLPLAATLGDAIAIGGYRFEPEVAAAGSESWVVLWWRPLSQPREVEGQLRLLASGFRPVSEARLRLPVPDGLLPPGQWYETRTRLSLPVDTPAPGYLAAELHLSDRQGPLGPPLWLHPLRVTRPGDWPLPGAHPLDLRFGNDMVLTGVQVEHHDQWLAIALFWRASWSGGLRWHDRQVTLELRDQAGKVVASTVGDPGEGWYRTSLWQPGDRILDERDLALPPGLAAGDYALVVRVRWPGGEVPPQGDPVVASLSLP